MNLHVVGAMCESRLRTNPVSGSFPRIDRTAAGLIRMASKPENFTNAGFSFSCICLSSGSQRQGKRVYRYCGKDAETPNGAAKPAPHASKGWRGYATDGQAAVGSELKAPWIRPRMAEACSL